MGGNYTLIEEKEMRDFLEPQGFKEVIIEGTHEIVFGKIIAKNICLRVYSSVAYINGESRGVGEDAVRVCVVYRKKDGTIVGIGRETRVNRVETWRKNLQLRLDKYHLLLTPSCKKCGEPTKERQSNHGTFYGCSSYPLCTGKG